MFHWFFTIYPSGWAWCLVFQPTNQPTNQPASQPASQPTNQQLHTDGKGPSRATAEAVGLRYYYWNRTRIQGLHKLPIQGWPRDKHFPPIPSQKIVSSASWLRTLPLGTGGSWTSRLLLGPKGQISWPCENVWRCRVSIAISWAFHGISLERIRWFNEI